MKLLEYQAQELFRKYGIPTVPGLVVRSLEELAAKASSAGFPAVVKAQVPVGGRGKAGGIRFAENAEELAAACGAMLGMEIKGCRVDTLYITRKVEVAKELYLSVFLDRGEKLPVAIFSSEGGVDIEETARTRPERIAKVPLYPEQGVRGYASRYFIDSSGLSASLADGLLALLSRLAALFLEEDCLLAEINPLGIDREGNLTALDGKVTIDDNALFRHKDFEALRASSETNPYIREARNFDFLYIPVRDEGNVAIVSNGSGMIMASLDLITREGCSVRSALDLGGGATSGRVAEAVRIMLSDPEVSVVFVNIFGGITRCDEIANGLRTCLEKSEAKPVVVRMEGTNRDKGVEALRGLEGRVTLVEDLLAGVKEIARRSGS